MADAQKRDANALKFTRELGHEICVRVESVGFEAVAAEKVGVHRNTVRNWRERGEKGEDLFVDFARELAAAKATWQEAQLKQVDDARWKLERVDREQFGNNQRIEHTGKNGRPIEQRHSHSLSHSQSVEIVSKILGVNPKLIEGKFKGKALPEDAGSEDGDE